MQVLKGMVLLLAIGTLVQVILWKPEPVAPAELQQLGLAAMKAQVAEQESLIEQQRSQIKALTAQIKTSGASSAANEKQPDAEESVDADTEGARQQGASGPEPAPAVPVPASEQKKEEQRSNDIKNWHNMSKKPLGVVSLRCMLPSPCTHRTECCCTLYIHGTYTTCYRKNVRTYVMYAHAD